MNGRRLWTVLVVGVVCGLEMVKLMARFGVSQATVYAVLSGRSWREDRAVA